MLYQYKLGLVAQPFVIAQCVAANQTRFATNATIQLNMMHMLHILLHNRAITVVHQPIIICN